MEIQRCHSCGVILTEQNSFINTNHPRRFCRACYAKKKREYYIKNRDRILARDKEYYWKNWLKIREKERIRALCLYGGKRGMVKRGLNKRRFQGKCELCEKEIKARPYYHHWDDSNLNKGIWVCYHCHRLVEAIDAELEQPFLREKYIDLKKRLDNDFAILEPSNK